MKILVLEKIGTNSLFTYVCELSEGIKDLVHIDVHWSDPPQKTIKSIRHDLLMFSKYGYAYKIKCSSNTLKSFKV